MIEVATQDELCINEEYFLSPERSVSETMDNLQSLIASKKPIKCPLAHTFTPGIYTRTIFMPKGTLIVSKIHKTEHPYFIITGKVTVFTENDGTLELQAPFHGVTRPGTRRALFIEEDCIWVTTHAITDGETLEEIEERIIEKHELPIKIENI